MRRARIIHWLVIAGAMTSPHAARAQLALPTPEARVRVSAPELDITADAGRLLRATVDSLTIDFAGKRGQLTIPIDRLSRLEVSTGKRRAAGFGQGAALGTVVGIFVGLGVGALKQLDCRGELCSLWFLVTVPGGAGIGLIVGSVAGVAWAPDRWESVSLSRQPSGLGMRGSVSGPGVGITIPF